MNGDNAEYGGNMDTLLTRVTVSHGGNMYWNAPLVVKGKCKIEVQDFPFDTQKCSLKFGSWTYDIGRLNMMSGGIDTCKCLYSFTCHRVFSRGRG